MGNLRNQKKRYRTLFRRKDGRWQGYYYDLDANGEPIRTAEHRHALCDRDRDRLNERLDERETPRVLTFREIVNEWQRSKWEEIAFKTRESYRAPVRDVLEEFGDCKLDEITAKDVTAFLNSLAMRGYAKRTVEMRKNIIAMAYEYAIYAGYVQNSPADHAKTPKNLPEGSRGIASDEAIETVINGLDKPFGLYPYLLLYSGLRRGEALALRYEDIDRKARVIRVTKSVTYVGNSPHIKEPKTDAGTREVPLLDALANALPLGVGYVFPNAKDPMKPMTLSQFRAALRQYIEAAGGVEMTSHQFRNAYATILEKAGIGWEARKKQIGHAKIQTTIDLYTHFDAELKITEFDKLNRYINQSTKYGACNRDCKNAKNA